MPENYEAWIIWQEIQTQVRAGPDRILGLDYAEFRQACRDLDITRSRGLEQKIKCLEKELINGGNR